MHDQSIEQKLRAALQAEGDGLPFTITAAELERRLALRRRGRIGPMASLGLAAAVGIGLLGLAGLAGGWFEQRTALVPSPSPAVAVSPAPSDAAPASPPPALVLASLDDLLAPLDPGTIVRAQAIGPATGPVDDSSTGITQSRGTAFAPVSSAGSYRLWTACIGDSQLQLVVIQPATIAPDPVIPITCDGSIAVRQIALDSGDALSVRSATPFSWRAVLELPGRDAPHAVDDPAPIVANPDDALLVKADSEIGFPDYSQLQTGGGIVTPTDLGRVIERERYRVLVSCAGPTSVRYAFGALYDQQNPPDPLPEDLVATQVDCDGSVHEDILEVPILDGANLAVTADARTAWHIIVVADQPPIALAPNVPGWTMSTASGPNWMTRSEAEAIDLIGGEKGQPIRVVITCAGNATLTGTIDAGSPFGTKADPYSIDCSETSPNRTLARVYPAAEGYIQVIFDAGGRTIWLAITGQAPGPQVPTP